MRTSLGQGAYLSTAPGFVPYLLIGKQLVLTESEPIEAPERKDKLGTWSFDPLNNETDLRISGTWPPVLLSNT